MPVPNLVSRGPGRNPAPLPGTCHRKIETRGASFEAALRERLRVKRRIAGKDALHAEALAKRASKHARRFRESWY
jgi:hypothetical protein